MKIGSALGVIFGMLCANFALAETGYIQARQAKIYAAPSLKAEPVASVEKGTAVEIDERQGRWLKVHVARHQGWVSSLLVGSNPPIKKITVLDDGAPTLDETARRRASAATSAAAPRGLRSEDRARQSDEGAANFDAVRQMETMGVSEEEAAKFAEEKE